MRQETKRRSALYAGHGGVLGALYGARKWRQYGQQRALSHAVAQGAKVDAFGIVRGARHLRTEARQATGQTRADLLRKASLGTVRARMAPAWGAYRKNRRLAGHLAKLSRRAGVATVAAGGIAALGYGLARRWRQRAS